MELMPINYSYYQYLGNQSGVEFLAEDDYIYNVPVGLVLLLSLLYGTISLLAIIGNFLVIWIVVTTRNMQTVTNWYIANLAMADVIIGAFAIPFQVLVVYSLNLSDGKPTASFVFVNSFKRRFCSAGHFLTFCASSALLCSRSAYLSRCSL